MNDSPLIHSQGRPDGAWELKLAGDISVFHAAALQQAATQAAEHAVDVVAECGELRSLDFAAAQVLLALERAVTSCGKVFRISGLSKDLAAMLSMVGLSELLAAAGVSNCPGETDCAGAAA